MTARPIFVFGVARSGTNLLARMLSRHPAVEVALDPLMPLFRSLRNAVLVKGLPPDRRSRFDPKGAFQDGYFSIDGPAAIDAILNGDAHHPVSTHELQMLLPNIVERATLESPALATRMQSLSGSDFGSLLRNALTIVAATKPSVAWVGIKELWVLDFVPLLHRLFPEARFYALQRDPRAIVASLIAMADRDSSQAAHVPSYMRHWRKSVAVAQCLAADPEIGMRFRVVSYESLVARPEIEARRLCEELAIEFWPEMLQLSSDGWKGNSSYEHGEKNVYATSADRWRNSLPSNVLQTTHFLCGPEMRLAGYQMDETPCLTADVLNYLRTSDTQPGSWRSDSGDMLRDLGGELARYALLKVGGDVESDLVRRCFLFEEIFLDAKRVTVDGREWS